MSDNITLMDDHQIFDFLASQKNPFLRGWVRMFIHKNMQNKGNPVVDDPNLVVGRGREFNAQRLFDMNGPSNDWKDYVITGFGIGRGGASISDGEPVINDAILDDSGLYSPITLNDSFNSETSSGANGVVKPIRTDGSIQLMDGGFGENTYYSKVKCSCVIKSGEPTSLSPGESQQISEAGLYATNGSNNILFSHICFAPKWKESESNLTIEWYIIC